MGGKFESPKKFPRIRSRINVAIKTSNEKDYIRYLNATDKEVYEG